MEPYLDGFAAENQAAPWQEFARESPMQWKAVFLDLMNRPTTLAFFNLKEVKVWPGVMRASQGKGGATDWELLQISQNEAWWPRIRWIEDGQPMNNPFA